MIEETLALKDQVSAPAASMGQSLTSLEGSLASAVTGFADGGAGASGFGGELDAIVPGIGIAIGAVAALTAALGGLVMAGANLALNQTTVHDKLLATFSAMEGGPAAGQATLDMLDGLSSRLPQTREQLGQWTAQFQAMGVVDISQLKGQVEATASAQALMGQTGAQAYTTLAKRVQEAVTAHSGLKIADRQLASLADAGVNVADVAAKMGLSTQKLTAELKSGSVDASKFGDALKSALIDKGGGALSVMSGDTDVMKAKFKENIGKLFESVNVAPFTDALRDMLGIFDQSTASGQALKFLVTGFFSGLFSIASKVFPYVKRFFLDLVIVGLKFYIALKPTIAAFKELFATKGDGDGLMGTIDGIASALTVVAGGVATAVGWFVKMLGVGKAVIGALSDAFSGIGSIASNMIEGLIGGITAGVGKVVDSAKNLAKGAMDAIKGTLGIHSPSQVFMQLGAHTASGFAEGIAANDTVGAAASDMGGQAIQAATYSVPSGGAQAGGNAQGGGGGGAGLTVNVQIDGAGKSALEITKEMVSLVFEEYALAAGMA